ncbi:MAG: pentapeptide repeat-containing protein [Actinomycetaceae bacterium]|nr:pentapeptide repeat-containing protein [Actinomycetaceae bacterium]
MGLETRPSSGAYARADEPHGSLAHEQLRGEDFSGLKFDNFNIWDSTLEECKFDRIKTRVFAAAAGGKVTEFIDCTFHRAALNLLIAGGRVRFINCSFTNARLTDWSCESVDFIDCTFEGTSLRSIQIWGSLDEPAFGSIPEKKWTNDIRGNDFSQAKILNVEFRAGVDLTQQQLPAGPDYIYIEDIPKALEKGHQLLPQLPEGRPQEAAAFLLERIETHYQLGQHQAFRHRLKTYPDEMWVPLREALNDTP